MSVGFRYPAAQSFRPVLVDLWKCYACKYAIGIFRNALHFSSVLFSIKQRQAPRQKYGYAAKVCGYMPITPTRGSSPDCRYKVRRQNWAGYFPLKLRDLNKLQYADVPVRKMISIKASMMTSFCFDGWQWPKSSFIFFFGLITAN